MFCCFSFYLLRATDLIACAIFRSYSFSTCHDENSIVANKFALYVHISVYKKTPLRSTTGRANKRCTTFVYIRATYTLKYMTYTLECLLSCNVDESEELMSNLVIYRFNFLGSSAQKLPSMISVLSTFQPAQNVSPSYGPDALSESFRHVLLFLMPLNICLFLSTILKCIG